MSFIKSRIQKLKDKISNFICDLPASTDLFILGTFRPFVKIFILLFVCFIVTCITTYYAEDILYYILQHIR